MKYGIISSSAIKDKIIENLHKRLSYVDTLDNLSFEFVRDTLIDVYTAEKFLEEYSKNKYFQREKLDGIVQCITKIVYCLKEKGINIDDSNIDYRIYR